MVQDRRDLVLYTTAVCNLNCRYCYIDKNEALVKIDNLLDESFKGDYYFNFAKKMFPDPNQLESVQVWGGEPMLRMDRCYYTLKKLIEHYPRFNTFTTSTNFTGSNWFEQFYGLVDVFRDFPNRIFYINLQLSLDGPKEINDASRGEGVTEKFMAHFEELLETAPERLPKNVFLTWYFKPTLDSGTIRLLQTKEAIIKYYSFFEQFYSKMAFVENDNFKWSPCIPNTACPSPHTVEDGKLFANLCKLCREIEKENKDKHYFRFYSKITPFTPRRNTDYNLSYNCEGGTCGTGKFTLGLLPNNMISCCHNGFVDLISDYKIKSQENHTTSLDFNFFSAARTTRMTLDLDGFKEWEKSMEYFYLPGTKTRIANMAQLINLLAHVKQVDEKYLDRQEALMGARYIESSCAYCIRDNINVTGTNSLYPVGLIKLLLNGAREYCEND